MAEELYNLAQRVSSLETENKAQTKVLDKMEVSLSKIAETMPLLVKAEDLKCNANDGRITTLEANQKWHKMILAGGLMGAISLLLNGVKSFLGLP